MNYGHEMNWGGKLLSFMFVIVSCWVKANMSRLFIYVLPLEIQLSNREIFEPYWPVIYATFCEYPKPGTGLPKSYMYVVGCFFLFACSMTWDERWLFVLLILVKVLTLVNLSIYKTYGLFGDNGIKSKCWLKLLFCLSSRSRHLICTKQESEVVRIW